MLVINWGTNDWNGGNSLTDYYAALTEFVETMASTYPNLVIVKLTPTQRFISAADGNYVSGSVHTSTAGVTLREYAVQDAQLTADYNLQVLDMFNIGINDFNKTHFFPENSYTHHNAVGRERLANVLAASLV